MEKQHDPRKINEKLRNLTPEQSKALSASLNSVYIEAELRRAGVVSDVPIRDKSGKLLFTVRYRLDSFVSEYNAANFTKAVTSAVNSVSKTVITAEGYAVNGQDQATLDMAEQKITTDLNTWLGTDSASEIFADRKPFASVDNGFFITQVFTMLNGIRQQVEKAIREYTGTHR